jgi:type IV secretion system protein TrbF
VRHFAAVAEIETPHQQARQRWAGHVGAIVEAKQWWKYTTLLCLLGWVGTVYFYGIKLDTKPPVEIVYVGIDADGIATILGKTSGTMAPTKLMIEERIRRFIVVTRGLVLDRDAVRKQWLEDAYQWVTPRGSALLTEWAKEREPLLKAGKISIGIEIAQMLRQSDHSYEVRWVETLRNQNNGVTEKSQWSGTYTTKVDKPKTDKEARANATGVFIDYFATTRTR